MDTENIREGQQLFVERILTNSPPLSTSSPGDSPSICSMIPFEKDQEEEDLLIITSSKTKSLVSTQTVLLNENVNSSSYHCFSSKKRTDDLCFTAIQKQSSSSIKIDPSQLVPGSFLRSHSTMVSSSLPSVSDILSEVYTKMNDTMETMKSSSLSVSLSTPIRPKRILSIQDHSFSITPQKRMCVQFLHRE